MRRPHDLLCAQEGCYRNAQWYSSNRPRITDSTCLTLSIQSSMIEPWACTFVKVDTLHESLVSFLPHIHISPPQCFIATPVEKYCTDNPTAQLSDFLSGWDVVFVKKARWPLSLELYCCTTITAMIKTREGEREGRKGTRAHSIQQRGSKHINSQTVAMRRYNDTTLTGAHRVCYKQVLGRGTTALGQK